jgi:hypothetical protein
MLALLGLLLAGAEPSSRNNVHDQELTQEDV